MSRGRVWVTMGDARVPSWPHSWPQLLTSQGASLAAQTVKNLPAMQTWVRSLGREDPLEKKTAHSSILAWRIPWTEEPGGLQSMGSPRVGPD